MAAILEPSVFFIAIFLVKVTNGENIIDYDNEDYDYTVDGGCITMDIFLYTYNLLSE